MEKKEVIDGLKSALTARVAELEAVQADGLKALKERDEAIAAEDQGLMAAASEKIEKIGTDIRAAQKAIEDVQDQMGWFKEYDTKFETKSTDEARIEEMRNLFESFKGGVGSANIKRTVGEIFADIVKQRGYRSWEDLKSVSGGVQLRGILGKDPNVLEDAKSFKSIKSLYTNNGVELLDANDDPVPGFVGYQCGLFEDPTVTCLLEPPKDDFEECVTQATMPSGNRIRFTREVSRDDNATSVPETIYGLYPDFEQDGTKPEGIFTLATSEVAVGKIAEFVVASDEVLEDCPSIASLIDGFLVSGINKEKRRQLIAGTGTTNTIGGLEMRGILNQPDLLERTHQDVADGGAATDNIYDTFRRALTDLWYQSASLDNVCVIMNPRDLEIIDLTKDEMGRYLFNDTDCFNRQLRCLKIRVSTDMPAGTAVMGEFSNNWVFYVRRALDIRMGYTGDQFITNTQTILGEMRGLSLVRCPRKIIKIDGLAA